MAVADEITTVEVLVAEEVLVVKEVLVAKEEVLVAAVLEANEAAAHAVVASVQEKIPVLQEEAQQLREEKAAFLPIGHPDVQTHRGLKVFQKDRHVGHKILQTRQEQEDREKANICLLIFL